MSIRALTRQFDKEICKIKIKSGVYIKMPSRSKKSRSHKKSSPFAAHVKKVAKETGLSGPKLFKAASKSYKKSPKRK